jgi:PAS domain S-box-containing protein
MVKQEAVVHEFISPLEAAQVWRQQLIQNIVRALTIPGFLALVVGSYSDYLYRLGRTIPFYVGAYAAFILVAFWRRAPHVLQAGVLLALIYGLGVVDLFNSGLSGDSGILFLAFSAMTTLLLGRRWGILALALGVVTMVAFGGAYSTGLLVIPVEKLVNDATNLSSWLNSAVALLMLSVLLVLSQNYLVRHLLTAFTRSRELTRELETDIAERKQVEEALAEERNLLRTLIDNLPDLIYAKDIRSRFVLANKANARFMGVSSPDELIGKTDFDFYPQDIASQFYADEQDLIESGQPMISKDEPNMDLTGAKRWLLTTKAPVRDNEGKIIGFVGVGHDVTGRRQAEQALRESEEKFRNIVEQASDAILLCDEQGAVVEWNRAAEQMTGLRAADVLGKFMWDVQFELLPKERKTPEFYERIHSVIRHALDNVQPQWFIRPLDGELQCPDGTRRYFQQTVFPIQTAKGVMLGSITRDFTGQVHAEKEREKLIHELEDALARVKTLSGFLPICANCKKIRDDRGEWHELEVYVRDHSNADFSHGICPECAAKLYPGFFR